MIKALEAQGIVPDIIVGTSAGAVVGALYAAGHNGFELQKLAHRLDEKKISDWSLPDRGVLKGECLQQFVNEAVGQRPLEALKKPFGAVATDLHSGREVWFQNGSLLEAVRASIALPGLFGPVHYQGRWLVDGGLVDPLPVSLCRALCADRVIAINLNGDIVGRQISGRAQHRNASSPLLARLSAGWQAILGNNHTNTAQPESAS